MTNMQDIFADQTLAIVNAIRQAARPADDNHLTEEQFLGYCEGTLPEETLDILDQHITSCEVCLSCLERLFSMNDSWQGSDDDRIAALRSEIALATSARKPALTFHTTQGLTEAIRIRTTPEARAYSRQVIYKETIDLPGDAKIIFSLQERKDGSFRLELRYETAQPLQPVTVVLQAGSWQTSVHLDTQLNDQLWGVIMLTAQDIENISDNPMALSIAPA